MNAPTKIAVVNVQKAMAEGVNALPVDIRDGAVGGHVHVARDQADADHGAGL